MAQLGRLPPLQAIGRSQRLELEDPPELSDSDIDRFLTEYENRGNEGIYCYIPQHAEAAASGLNVSFRVLHPGGHVCKRTPDQAPGFTHCKHSIGFATKYAELCHLLQSRAELQFVQDYTSRVNQAATFVRELEELTRHEFAMWWAICQEKLNEVPHTKLEHLGSLCEDLRIHVNHWNSLKQLIHTDPWLRQKIPSLTIDINIICQTLTNLRDQAIAWLSKLIHIGFHVIAHCDLERFTQDSLWAITRGLEDFNAIVSTIRGESKKPGPALSLCDSVSPHKRFSAHSNSCYNLGASVRPISFAQVLGMLASERSKYAATATHDFFASSKDFLHMVVSRRLPGYSWADDCQLFKTRLRARGDTSDYHSASGSHISLGTAMLHVGPIVAPDLSHQPSPLIDFHRREQNFATKFLQIVSHSTALLKKPKLSASSEKHGAKTSSKKSSSAGLPPRPHAPRLSKTTKGSPVGSKPPVAPASTTSAAHTTNTTTVTLTAPEATPGTKRKSVSWGDTNQMGLVNQVTQQYLDLLWASFGASLWAELERAVWGGADTACGQLGNIRVCPDMVQQLLIRMIQQTCAKDLFPASAVPGLHNICRKLHITMSWTEWDKAFSQANASRMTDKCYPVPLSDGTFSTKTAKCLRDCFFPLHSALQRLQEEEQDLPDADTDFSLLLPSTQRLLLTCNTSATWCQTKSLQFLASWTLGAFLLVTQSDIKILLDEIRQVVRNCEVVCSRPQEEAEPTRGTPPTLLAAHRKHQFQVLAHSLGDVQGQVQSLSSLIVKRFAQRCSSDSREFFEDELPTGKCWRRKIHQEAPTRHNDYVEHALDTLIEPVVAGVSKLRPTAQLSAVSMAVTAMCEAWTDVILKQRIRFSVMGAAQLHLDFEHMKEWLAGCLGNPEVKQSVLALDIFKYLAGIVELLGRQPRGRSLSGTRSRYIERRPPAPSGSTEPRSMCCHVSVTNSNHSDGEWKNMGSSTLGTAVASSDYTTSSESEVTATVTRDSQHLDSAMNGSSGLSEHVSRNGDHSNGKVNEDGKEHYKIPKMEHWLALRVHGGARNWPRLPSCFNSPQTT